MNPLASITECKRAQQLKLASATQQHQTATYKHRCAACQFDNAVWHIRGLYLSNCPGVNSLIRQLPLGSPHMRQSCHTAVEKTSCGLRLEVGLQ